MSARDDATEAREEAEISPFPHHPVVPSHLQRFADNGNNEPAESLDSQVERLARFIQENYSDEIHNEGAIDTAIRLLGTRLAEPMPAFGIDLSGLRNWMADHHSQLQAGTLAKAAEYGALDLQIMGASLAEVVPNLGEDAPPASKLQAAIAFYLLGKVSRVLSALAEGKPAPTDSWLDAEVYSMMGAYVQEYGRWP